MNVVLGESDMTLVTRKPITLQANTAEDLMSRDPVSIRGQANYSEALEFFLERNITAAPVVDESGRPTGVISVTDLLVHARECGASNLESASVAALMTPTVFTVSKDAPVADVVRDLLRANVHHLFVTDADATVIGVISTRDVLRRLS
jgi:CBS domain-containing membrane protein